MSLLFGNLVQDFVNFTVALQNINPNDPQSSANARDAAEAFRNVAAKDASYLTYIGARDPTSIRRLPFIPPSRRRHVYLHLHLHVYLGSHG
jgi:hypothetical protein